MAHYFSYDYSPPQDVLAYSAPLRVACEEWRRGFSSSDFFFVDRDGDLAFLDLRPVARAPFSRLSGLDRALYLACDAPCGVVRLRAVAAETLGRSVAKDEVLERLQPLVDASFMLHEGGRYLSLALRVGEYEPRLRDMARLEVHAGWQQAAH